MIITHAGGYCFKLVSGDTAVAVNPPGEGSSFKVSKFGADVVIVSKPDDEDWNGVETATHGDKEPFAIKGPGSYEVGEVVADGWGVDEFRSSVYLIRMDGMNVLILGALSGKLPSEVREDLDDVDIVLVPVGGDTLDPKAAHDLVTALEPHLVIPYQVGKGGDLKQFLKAEGATDTKPVDKLTLRAKEVSAMDGEVAIFE